MGTIIAHAKGQWGRATKNKRVDSELEEEINSIDSPKSVATPEAEILKEITGIVDHGTKIIQRLGGDTPPPIQAPAVSEIIAPSRRTYTKSIVHNPTIEKKYKTEEVSLVPPVPISLPVKEVVEVQEVVEPPKPKPRKKTNKKKYSSNTDTTSNNE